MAGSPDPKPTSKKKRRASMPASEKEAARLWRLAVVAKWPWSSVDDSDLEAHHVVFAQVLRRRARELGLEAAVLLWDPRGGMPLGRERHRRFHAGLAMIARRELPPDTIEFARELDLEWWLERRYS